MEQKQIIAIVLIIALVATGLFIYTDTTSATIDVQGNSIVKEAPDKVVVYFRIESTEDTAEAAKNSVAKITADVTNALYFAGINKEQITTENYNIYPRGVWKDDEYTEEGYTATQMLKVETTEFGKTGRIIDLGVDNGALVSYINFELSEEKQNQLKTQALKEASEDAKNKAKGIAEGLGKKLGKVVSIQTSDYNYYPYRVFGADSAKTTAQEVATDINPDNIDVRASVTVKYKIW